ncbi:MAG: stage II sporulation protein R [Clostridia bacterium]|nr:stage II sporulation protein R [Clostridia bacterium]
MKKFGLIGLFLFAILAIMLFCGGFEDMGTGNAAYLRVHIRADSNESAAQAVKYKVRDAVVEYLTPTVAACETKEEAMKKIRSNLAAIEKVAERVLCVNGFSYSAKASLRREEFPTRVYENVTLEAGVYDALILELGAGKGDNWWCVIYPPLCFTGGGGNVIYRSKILEIIQQFFR